MAKTSLRLVAPDYGQSGCAGAATGTWAAIVSTYRSQSSDTRSACRKPIRIMLASRWPCRLPLATLIRRPSTRSSVATFHSTGLLPNVDLPQSRRDRGTMTAIPEDMTDGDNIAAAVMAAGLCGKISANPDEYVQNSSISYKR
jgi:hypothetical protein